MLLSRIRQDSAENSIMQTITIAVSAILIAAGLITAPGLINNARDNNARGDLANIAYAQEVLMADQGSYSDKVNKVDADVDGWHLGSQPNIRYSLSADVESAALVCNDPEWAYLAKAKSASDTTFFRSSTASKTSTTVTSLTIPACIAAHADYAAFIADSVAGEPELPEEEEVVFSPQGDFVYTTGSGSTITNYVGSNTDVRIPNAMVVDGVSYPVVSIAANAFMNKGLTSVTIPDTVSSINDYSFYGNLLTSVDLPEALEGTVGSYAFANNKLTEVEIPNSVISVNSGGFSNNQITSLAVPEGFRIFGTSAFSQNKISSLSLPSTVNSIGQHAFSNNLLTELNLPNTVTHIDVAAFSFNQISSLTLPDSIVGIGQQAFVNNKITNLVIPKNVKTLGAQAFQQNLLTSVLMKGNVPTTVGANVFYLNPSLTRIQRAAGTTGYGTTLSGIAIGL